MRTIWPYLLLLMLPLYFMWIFPTQEKVKETQKEVQVLNNETGGQQAKIKTLKDLDTLLSNPKYNGVLERVPLTLEQETLILLLDRIAKSTGFVFDGISFSRGQNPALEANTLEARFSIKGRQDKFKNFLQAVEKSPRFMGLETFAYSVETINDIDIISMSVPLYTFAQSSKN